MGFGTKWKPHEPVEFKHVVEMSERLGRMSDDSCLVGHVWNELQSARGKVKQLREDNAGLLAGADADAFVIGNLNAHVAKIDADKK